MTNITSHQDRTTGTPCGSCGKRQVSHCWPWCYLLRCWPWLHQIQVIPNISLVCKVPRSIEESLYQGQIIVSIKNATFQPSNPLCGATELRDKVHKLSINTISSPVLLLHTDGGPDHSVTFGSVSVSVIAFFWSLKLDYFLALHTWPGQSFCNPVECCIANQILCLQSHGLMRAPASEDVDKALSAVNTTSDIWKLATKNPFIQPAVEMSLQPDVDTLE